MELLLNVLGAILMVLVILYFVWEILIKIGRLHFFRPKGWKRRMETRLQSVQSIQDETYDLVLENSRKLDRMKRKNRQIK